MSIINLADVHNHGTISLEMFELFHMEAWTRQLA